MLATMAAVLVLLGSLVAGLGAPLPDANWPLRAETIASGSDGRLRVEVLNGAGVSGLAREVTERLRALGYDVVYYGNAGSLTRDSSVVLDRAGDPVASARVAEDLGIPRIEAAADTTLYLEATVILGPDWPELQKVR